MNVKECRGVACVHARACCVNCSPVSGRLQAQKHGAGCVRMSRGVAPHQLRACAGAVGTPECAHCAGFEFFSVVSDARAGASVGCLMVHAHSEQVVCNTRPSTHMRQVCAPGHQVCAPGVCARCVRQVCAPGVCTRCVRQGTSKHRRRAHV